MNQKEIFFATVDVKVKVLKIWIKKGEDDIGESNETHVNNGIIENDETCKQDEIGKTLIKLVHIWKLLKLMKLAIWI